MESYAYTLIDNKGMMLEGFDQVAQVITKFWHDLLGKQTYTMIGVDKEIKKQGTVPYIEQ